MTINELPAGDWRLTVYGRTRISGQDRRRSPRIGERKRVQLKQANRCLYCEIPIGTQIWRGNKSVPLRSNWDHFVPYSYAQRNRSQNWVLACHVCNAIKTAKMFDSVQAAREVILPARARKGYESPESVLQRLDLRQTTSVVAPTSRQLEALRLAGAGLSTDRVIEDLGLRSRAQFRDLISRACLRLEVLDLDQAVEVAAALGFIPAPEGGFRQARTGEVV